MSFLRGMFAGVEATWKGCGLMQNVVHVMHVTVS